MNLNELKAQRADAFSAAEKLINSARATGKDLAGAELAQYNGYLSQIRELDSQIAKCEEVGAARFNGTPVAALTSASGEKWRTQDGRGVTVLSKGDSAVRAFSASQPNFTFGEFVRAMVKGTRDTELQNALSEAGGTSTGAVTVPVVLLPQLIDNLRAKTVSIQAGAKTVLLDTATTNIARISADPTPAWRSESAAFAESAPTFEKVSFTPQSLGVLVKVSHELLEDSVNLNEALLMAFAGAFAVELDRVALFGSGSAPEPHGIKGTTNVASVDMGTNGAALTNYDPFVDAISALLTANTNMPTAAIMAPRTLAKIAKLKDSQNQPLRRPDLLSDLPFLATTGVPVNQTKGTSNVASEIIVGDFTQLIFGIRHDLRITVLRDRFWADNGQIGFVADLRADVQLRHPQSFCEVLGVL